MRVSEKRLSSLTSRELSDRLTANSILCLPVGSIEQHGPHLPLDTDVIIAETVAQKLIEHFADTYDLWQLPTLAVTLAREHEWAHGTLSLSIDTLVGMLRDIGRSIARATPTRHLIMINGHGGNSGVLSAVAQDLRADHGLNVCIFHPAGLVTPTSDGGAPDYHGGMVETSLMLALAPERVRDERLRDAGPSSFGHPYQRAIARRGVSWPWTSDDARIAQDGVIGDPRGATAEAGAGFLKTILEAGGAVLEQLLANPLPASTR